VLEVKIMMIVCEHCYEEVTEEARQENEVCPFCYNRLPEPEPEQEAEVEPEPVEEVFSGWAGMTGPADNSPGLSMPIEIEEPKSKTALIAGVVAVVIALVAGGYFMFGGKGSGEGGTKSGKKGISPKFIAAMKVLDTKIQKSISYYFQKTCKPFQEKGYSYTTQLQYNDKGDFVSKIDPGDGIGEDDDWFQCPIKISEINSYSPMTIELLARYVPAPDMFSKVTRYLKINFKGQNIKPFEKFKANKSMFVNTWEIKTPKDKKTGLSIACSGLYKGPKTIKSFNGYHEVSSTGRKKRKRYSFMHKGAKFTQIKARVKVFGTYTGTVRGWFGKSFTKSVKDWGSGCQDSITANFKNILKQMIESKSDIQFFKDEKKLAEYMSIAEKGGKKLCSTMPNAHKILMLYQNGKDPEAKTLTDEFQTDLNKAKAILTKELSSLVKNLGSKSKKGKPAKTKK
jgi:hypothetical protein